MENPGQPCTPENKLATPTFSKAFSHYWFPESTDENFSSGVLTPLQSGKPHDITVTHVRIFCCSDVCGSLVLYLMSGSVF